MSYLKKIQVCAAKKVLYHGSKSPDLTVVQDSGNPGLDFGGIFASPNWSAASSHGRYVYKIELDQKDCLYDIPETPKVMKIILDNTYLDPNDYEGGKNDDEYQFDLDLLTSLILEEKNMFSLHSWIDFRQFEEISQADNEDERYQAAENIEKALEKRIQALFGKDNLGEASWEVQIIRGKIAKKLGYKAVSTEDEHGTSYLVLPGVRLEVYEETED